MHDFEEEIKSHQHPTRVNSLGNSVSNPNLFIWHLGTIKTIYILF